jgi:hypothetical protein
MHCDVRWLEDGNGRTLLNFLIHCPKGTMFIKSIDALAHVKDVELLCESLDEFIQEAGVQHLVQLVTNNASNYVATGKLLMEKHPIVF